MTQAQAYTLLGSGSGYVYFTASDGVFPVTSDNRAFLSLPLYGYFNDTKIQPRVQAQWTRVRKSVYNTQARVVITLTNAAADNLTVLNIGGVAQIGGAVAMTAGNLTASAASIVAAVNAYNPGVPYNWSAIQSGATIVLTCEVTGAAPNGQATTVTFSGGSTATSTPAGGGSDADANMIRVFIDVDPAATETSWTGNRTEITDAIAGGFPNDLKGSLTVAASAISYQRKTPLTIQPVNGTPLTTVVGLDVMEGDQLILTGDSSGSPTTVNSGGNINLVAGSRVLNTDQDTLNLYWKSGAWFEGTPRGVTISEARAAGLAVPYESGTATQAMNLGGGAAYSYAMGDPAQKYTVRFTGSGNLLANISITATAGANIIDGDEGWFIGNGSAVTYTGAFTITAGGISIPASIALSGNWKVHWMYSGGSFRYELLSNITESDIIDSPQLKNGAVTNDKVASGLDGAKILANSIPVGQLEPSVQAAIIAAPQTALTIVIPSADVLNLFATPLQLIAAPPAGQAIVVLDAQLRVIFNTTAYNAGDRVDLRTSTATTQQFRGNLDVTLDRVAHFAMNTTSGAGQTMIIAAQPLLVTAPAAPTLGDSDIQVWVRYKIINL